jgi:hypothetical protein
MKVCVILRLVHFFVIFQLYLHVTFGKGKKIFTDRWSDLAKGQEQNDRLTPIHGDAGIRVKGEKRPGGRLRDQVIEGTNGIFLNLEFGILNDRYLTVNPS